MQTLPPLFAEPAKLSKRDTEDRLRIERIWRDLNGHGDNVELAGSDAEWAFFTALLRASTN